MAITLVGVVDDAAAPALRRHLHAAGARRRTNSPPRSIESDKQSMSVPRLVAVQQRDRFTVTDHDVLEAHVVVAHHLTARGIGHLVAPGCCAEIKPDRRVVQTADQTSDRAERSIGLRPSRIRRGGDVAGDEPETLTSVRVDPDRHRCPVEPSATECAEEAVDRLRVWIRRAKNVIPDTHLSPGIGDTTMEYFLIGHRNILVAAGAAPVEHYRSSRRAQRRGSSGQRPRRAS